MKPDKKITKLLTAEDYNKLLSISQMRSVKLYQECLWLKSRYYEEKTEIYKNRFEMEFDEFFKVFKIIRKLSIILQSLTKDNSYPFHKYTVLEKYLELRDEKKKIEKRSEREKSKI